MSFFIKNLTASAVIINDLGIQLEASETYDMVPEDPKQVAISLDLVAAINADDVIVLDPLDGVSELSKAQSVEVVQIHNDPHYGIRGGTLNQLDDVDFGGSPIDLTDTVLQWNNVDSFVPVDPSTLTSTDDVEEIIANFFVDGDDTTVTLNGSPPTSIQIDVNDSFLRNDGDTLDSGTLTIAEGATLLISGDGGSGGATLTIGQDATATIETPTGNFTDPNQIINKAYVDSVAAGFDPKESVRVATTAALSGTPVGGSPAGFGTTITVGGASLALDGITVANGDRVLVKNGVDDGSSPTTVQNQWNGIYVVSGVGSSVVLTRAEDQDGTPNSEVSGGNFTFVEEGNTHEDTGWVVYMPNGIADVDVDDILWSQFTGAGSFTADIGISQSGNVIALNLSPAKVASATPAVTDRIAFHDVDGPAQIPTATRTYGATFQETFNALDVPYGISTTGFITRTGEDTYLTRTIAASATLGLEGIDVQNGDGVSAAPTIGLDINSQSATPQLDSTDELILYDSATGGNLKITGQNLADSIAGLQNILAYANIDADSGSTSALTAGDTFALVGAANGGITTVAADAVGSPPIDTITFALDINDLSTGAPGDLDDTDFVAVYDGTNTVKYSWATIVQELDLGGDKWTTINGDTGQLVANETNDTLDLVGGVGITTNASQEGSPLTDTVEFDLTFANIPAGTGTIDDTDEIIVNEGGTIVKYTFEDLVNDLDIPSVSGEGIVVKTSSSPDAWTTREIEVNGVGVLDGLAITDGDAINGNPTLGLDITGTPAKNDDLEATDEIIVYDAAGSPAANVKITGQELADGVAAIIDLPVLEVADIGNSGAPSQQELVRVDTSRGSKKLSIAEFSVTWAENRVGNNDWVEIGNAVDANSGYVMPMDGTIVRITAHTADDNNRAKTLDLYIDGTLTQAAVVDFNPATNTQNEFTDPALNIDVDGGEKIRLRGGTSPTGPIEDLVVTMWIKWNAGT